MRHWCTCFHVLIGAAWMSAALYLCVQVVLYGTAERSIATARGAALSEKRQVIIDRERVRRSLDWEASFVKVHDAVRRLELPITTTTAREEEEVRLAADRQLLDGGER